MAVLARRVRPDQWMPIGVNALEANAMDVVRSIANRSVIAGPGAGKTELLAQRAAYLLQTGASQPPQRILAISFKRDAATNLAARVAKRCHRSHAGRLDSMTFDAFAKGLVDRFGQALPEQWRPRPDYEIMFANDAVYRGFLLQDVGTPPEAIGTYADLQAISVKTFERSLLVGKPLPVAGWPSPTVGEWAADRFWQSSLHEGKKTLLSFPMIGRLAELLLRVNSMARDALRLTYSHLFMDEFQDTTQIQYDLVRTIFMGTDAVITPAWPVSRSRAPAAHRKTGANARLQRASAMRSQRLKWAGRIDCFDFAACRALAVASSTSPSASMSACIHRRRPDAGAV